HKELIRLKTGISLNIKTILIKDKTKKRVFGNAIKITDDYTSIMNDPDINLVVELVGGVSTAKELLLCAISKGKHVVTANKALLADCGVAVVAAANEIGVKVGFEASVCGGIPLIRSISKGLVADKIDFFCGIVNGTCNYILTQMTDNHLSFADALSNATNSGFCEADPTLDINGQDAAQKLAILAALSFGANIRLGDIHTEGIKNIRLEDVLIAEHFGYKIKHLVVGRNTGQSLELRATPVLVDKKHPLANVNNEYNAMLIRSSAIGELIFSGKGAGPLPTSAAVLADDIEIAADLKTEKYSNNMFAYWDNKPVLDAGEAESEYYLRVPITDKPGVIGAIATILGSNNVSIKRADAELVRGAEDAGNVSILTHKSYEKQMSASINDICTLPSLRGTPVAIRIGIC
ncbi:MAG: homoserine dehydrogenase, partial [Gammaproteobacteria bacterium]|nr:homoserine dehydrogenase [Gammaproteobacteria bacterium]